MSIYVQKQFFLFIMKDETYFTNVVKYYSTRI